MNKLDDLAWKREFDRVEANQESRYRDFDEYMASLDMERQKDINTRSAIAIRKIAAERSKKLEKQRLREAFLNRVRQVLTLIAIAIVAYTLFHFA